MRSQKIVSSLLVILSLLAGFVYCDDSIDGTIDRLHNSLRQAGAKESQSVKPERTYVRSGLSTEATGQSSAQTRYERSLSDPSHTIIESCQSFIDTYQVSSDCDTLSARDNIMNDLIDRYPPVLMRIEERPLFFECLDFNEVEIKLLGSIYDPAPYCGTVAGTYFKGYWTPETYVGIYLNKRLVKTVPLQLGKTTFTLKERNRPFRPVKGCLKGVLEVTKDEVPIKVLGYCVKSRAYDKKEEFLKPYFLPQANERIVERHFGDALVYKLSLSVFEFAPPQLTGPYYETGYTPSPSCSVRP